MFTNWEPGELDSDVVEWGWAVEGSEGWAATLFDEGSLLSTDICLRRRGQFIKTHSGTPWGIDL